MTKLLSENINRAWSSLIVDELIKNGITHFYISPGMRNAPLIAALAHFKKINSKIVLITCMDERGASYRALGYAKSTGKPVVLICTSGTAMANYYPAVIESKNQICHLLLFQRTDQQSSIFVMTIKLWIKLSSMEIIFRVN